MKCPNCGNEAINVNGKFVCLDCGIEISGNEQTTTAPQVGNHTEPEPEPVGVGAQVAATSEPSFFSNSNERVIAPPPSSQTGPSLKEQYLAELEREEKTQNTGVFDFSAPASGPTPDFPVGTDTPVAGMPGQAPAPAPVAAEPVVTSAAAPSSLDFDALSNVSAATSDPVSAPAEPAATAPVVAEEPEAPNITLEPVQPIETSSIAEVPEVSSQAEEVLSSESEAKLAPTEPVQPIEAPANLTPDSPAEAEVQTPNPFDVTIPPVAGMGDPVPAEELPEAVTEAPALPTEEQPKAEVFNPAIEEEEIEIPINKATVNTENSNPTAPVSSEPESYFQPGSINITPQSQEAVLASVETPVGSVANGLEVAQPEIPENIEAPVEPINMTSTTPATPTEVEATETSMPSPDLDALLDKYSGPASSPAATPQAGSVDSVRPSQFSNYDLSKEAPVVPGSDSIPSVSSVFEDGYVDPNPAIEKKAKKNKKLIIIVGIIFAALLIIGAVAAFFIASTNAQNQERAKIQQFEKAVMEGVPGKIEGDQNMRVTYRDAIDFSKLSIKSQAQEAAAGQELLKLFSTPFISEGNWEVNTEKNIAQNSRVNGQSFIRVYIEPEKMTYVSDGGSWKKLEGRQIVGVPAFFNPVERGSLFYSSKVERLIYQKKITGTEKTLYEFKVEPKQELLREAILGTSILFAKAKVEKIDASNLTILVQVDEEKNLHNVIVKGEATITADLFEGTISFDSFADYLYTQVEIQKPEMAFLDKKQV